MEIKNESLDFLKNKTLLTFIPARESTLLNLYWPDWTGVVYMSASLNWSDKEIQIKRGMRENEKETCRFHSPGRTSVAA